MQKKIYIIIAVVIVILAIFFLTKNKAVAPTPDDTVVTPDTSTTTPNETPVPNTPSPTPTYSYTNSEFDFAVTLPGLVVARRQSSDQLMKPIIFTFGVGDQSNVDEQKRVPNKMAVYVWKNPAEFQLLMINMTPVKETVNGNEFDVYTVTEAETTIYRYAIKRNGILYDVGVRNKADAKNFYLI